MTRNRRTTLALMALAAACATLGTSSAQAQGDYPAKPLRFIVPYPAGGGTDTIARLIGTQLTQRWGQPVVVENKPGASGILGNDIVAKAPGDGYTVLMGITAVVQIPALYKKVPYKLADLAPVSQIAKSADLLMVPRSSGVTTLAQFVDKAKAAPGTMNYGTYGNATSSHMNGERFKQQAGIDLTHIPYQGSGPEMAALLGGQLTLAFVDATAAYPHIKSDKLNILAVTGSQRFPSLPNVPTMAESGYPGLEANGWFGVFLPASTPKPIVDKLGAEVAAIVKSPELNKRLTDMGLIAVGSLPDDFKTQVEKDAAHWKAVAEGAKISMD
ncbi:tripartite tricarboxylate transporter substrate binding protein [Diaphorobacter limosus]|jgi:tripartite-type tricarboxylate transporter receptor subunit TctC|uniref:Tripartite tricarboxylate transporter substrate binding protein n=1 Tax=Diaphorobacter limosus TaxID=3036128 RepID=A0ABZ0J223_9BURK|nr:tripartite tricarboxylate transporter substrate binding protein [Diaphorobacter sp. Y-1]MBP8138581.1 tripartite tricarboxylate transporter substrate binding protein [Alicycliphilus sp.]WOO31192.1 tripartite tricarboxylate transporter substrate binding protein [Diaphorobacter sp. Y-1]